jgi:hypothetical protein
VSQLGLFSNPAAGQASNAYNGAVNTAGMLGGAASGIGSNLTPFLTQEMLHPQGIGQQGLSAEEAAATGGAGGSLSAFQGTAVQRAGASRNGGAFQAALDDASRSASKASAGASEGIAAGNEQLKQRQQQEGAAGLGGMYNTDTSGMLNAMNQEHSDINAETEASTPPWLKDMGMLTGGALNIAKLGGGFGIPGFQGFGK